MNTKEIRLPVINFIDELKLNKLIKDYLVLRTKNGRIKLQWESVI